MKHIVKTITTSLGALFYILAINSAQAVEMRPLLTLDIAEKMALTCEKLGQREGYRPLNIAIVASRVT